MPPSAPFQRLLLATVYGCSLFEVGMGQPAYAQTAGAYVLPACNPTTQQWPIGQVKPQTQDQFGNTCNDTAGSSGVAQTVNQGASGTVAWPVTVSGTATVVQGAPGGSGWLVSGTVAQGASGATAWPVVPQGGTVSALQSGAWQVNQGSAAPAASAWPVTVSGVTPTTSGALPVYAAQSGTWTATQGGSGATAWPVTISGATTVTSNQGTSGATAWPTTATQSGTWTTNATAATGTLASGLSGTVVTVTGAAATLMGYYCLNPNTSLAYVQIFDVSGTVTLGVSVPKWSIGIPVSGAANLSAMNIAFSGAIKVAATTTSVGATGVTTAVDCNFAFR